MSRSTGQRLTIVEATESAACRRKAAEKSKLAKSSSTKRTRSAVAVKSIKKAMTARKNSSDPGSKAKTVARRMRSRVAARTMAGVRSAGTEMAAAPILPIEMDLLVTEIEPTVSQPDSPAEEAPLALELSCTDVEATTAEGVVADDVQPEVESPAHQITTPTFEVIAAPELTDAADAITPSETPAQDPLPPNEPQTIRRSLAFQWSVFLQLLCKGWNWLQQRLKTQQSKKRLRVCESVSLGEKRFIAVVQVDGEQFLVGGSSSSVSTLAHLEQPREFSDVFRRYEHSGMQA